MMHNNVQLFSRSNVCTQKQYLHKQYQSKALCSNQIFVHFPIQKLIESDTDVYKNVGKY